VLFDDPLFPQQWHLSTPKELQASEEAKANATLVGAGLNVGPAWSKGYSGRGVVVTIVDDGVEHDHPDLVANYDPLASTDLNGRDDDPYVT
jgi:subtilisin family serine protease